MSIAPARKAAFDVLLRIDTERAYSSVLLPMHEERLSAEDRGLCHELVLGTLRRQMRLDRIVDQLTGNKKLDPEVRIALRVGAFQILHLDKVPAWAAINDSVELAKRARKSSAAGFVNAILRRIDRAEFEIQYADDIDRISVETSHPRWLIERWAENYGLGRAESLATKNNAPPMTAFRAIGEPDPQTEELIRSATASDVVPGCYLLSRSNRDLRQLAHEGKVYLQDEASQLVAHAVKVPQRGRFLDVCAAPGGKTGLVASCERPAFTAAGDLHATRVAFLQESARRQKVQVEVVRYDAERSLPFDAGSFDAVLVDAPCSGTGTIRHNPEIRYSLDPEDIAELALKQRRILAEASKSLKKGGLLVYSTCSIEPEEGEDVAERFTRAFSDFIRCVPRVPKRFVDVSRFARTWPDQDEMDGFFIAAFNKA